MTKSKSLIAGAVLALAGVSAMAAAPTCTSTTGWGELGPPGYEFFGNSFNSAGSYTDCYTFSLGSAADSFGGTIELDSWLNSLDINLLSVSLYSGDAQIGSDSSPGFFSFAGLSGGGYTLAVSSQVTSHDGLWDGKVGYLGLIATIAAPVPEPQALALMLVGIAGVGGALALRRRRG